MIQKLRILSMRSLANVDSSVYHMMGVLIHAPRSIRK